MKFPNLPQGAHFRLAAGGPVHIKEERITDQARYVANVPPRNSTCLFQLYTWREIASLEVIPTDDPLERERW